MCTLSTQVLNVRNGRVLRSTSMLPLVSTSVIIDANDCRRGIVDIVSDV